MLNNLEGNYY